MSQAGILNVSGSGGSGSPIQTISTDINGPASPVSNDISILGRDTTVNNSNGIRTNNDPNGSKFVYVEITNRLQGEATQIGVGDSDLINIDLGSASMGGGAAGTYKIKVEAAVFNSSTPSGAIFEINGGVRTTGAAGAATIIGTPDKTFDKEAALNNIDINIVVSGNNFIVRLTNNTALTITWGVVCTYVFRSS